MKGLENMLRMIMDIDNGLNSIGDVSIKVKGKGNIIKMRQNWNGLNISVQPVVERWIEPEE